MSGPMIPLTVASLLLVTSSAFAQDLSQYDPAGYSGGYAEGVSGPLGSDQLYPFDAQETWQHGYIQYMPFYGAYKHFRPYNYKNVLSQTQTAAGWGMSAKMPYSQQYWHRYHERSRMGNNAPSANYQSLPVFRKPEQQSNVPPQQNHGQHPAQQSMPQQQFIPPGQVPQRPPQIQPLPVPQRGGALQFTPAPHQNLQIPRQNLQPHTGVSYQYPAQQPSAIQSSNRSFAVPQMNAPINQNFSQQPLLIAP